MFTFIELSGFSKHRARLLMDDEFKDMQEALITNPEAGPIISGTGGFRKLRWSRAGMGKSGGVRVIYYNLSRANGSKLSNISSLCQLLSLKSLKIRTEV